MGDQAAQPRGQYRPKVGRVAHRGGDHATDFVQRPSCLLGTLDEAQNLIELICGEISGRDELGEPTRPWFMDG